MNRYRQVVECAGRSCSAEMEIEFGNTTRSLVVSCPQCGRSNRVVLLPPKNGEQIKVIVTLEEE